MKCCNHSTVKNKLILLTFFVAFTMVGYAQELFTGSNQCLIRIETDKKEYQFTTSGMSARLNDVMSRFEFYIPVSAIRSLRDSSDLDFLKGLTRESEGITITAPLPDDKDAELDLSYFKGNKTIQLAGETVIGKFRFEDDFDFNGMFMGSNQKMAFNFNIFINARRLTLANVNNEQIIEIELDAKGDKIIGLTSNN